MLRSLKKSSSKILRACLKSFSLGQKLENRFRTWLHKRRNSTVDVTINQLKTINFDTLYSASAQQLYQTFQQCKENK